MTDKIEQITLAGGCFWCIESAFNQVTGIISALSGYMGGETVDPGYQSVCSGKTGHAEVVQLTFDSEVINVEEILEIFFTLHDPTQLNRQGNDIGSQYRSAIFYHSEQQKKLAKMIIEKIEQAEIWLNPVVTQLNHHSQFYFGEDYHQGYFNKNPDNPYCQALISPKLAKFRKTFTDKLKKS